MPQKRPTYEKRTNADAVYLAPDGADAELIPLFDDTSFEGRVRALKRAMIHLKDACVEVKTAIDGLARGELRALGRGRVRATSSRRRPVRESAFEMTDVR